MNENLLTIEKRSSINGTFWKKRLINDSLDTDKITDSKLNSILETILYGRNIKKEDFDDFLDPKVNKLKKLELLVIMMLMEQHLLLC